MKQLINIAIMLVALGAHGGMITLVPTNAPTFEIDATQVDVLKAYEDSAEDSHVVGPKSSVTHLFQLHRSCGRLHHRVLDQT